MSPVRRGAAVLGAASACLSALAAAVLAAGWGRAAVGYGALPLGALAGAGWLFALRRVGLVPRGIDHAASASLGLGAFLLSQYFLYNAAYVAPSPRAAELMASLDSLRGDIESQQEWAKGLPQRTEAVKRMAARAPEAGADAGGETKVFIGGAFRAQVRAQLESLSAELKERKDAYAEAVSLYHKTSAELEALGSRMVLRYHPPGERLRDFRRRRGEPGYGFISFIRDSVSLRRFGAWGLFFEAVSGVFGALLPGLLAAGLRPALMIRCEGCGQALRAPADKGPVTVRCPRCRRTRRIDPYRFA
ncbi:MAG: hypothetical protein HY928_18450 [Elusimicrobia bacterium]|nr:hypothetical protein [Elusimicrobiota bacterium]